MTVYFFRRADNGCIKIGYVQVDLGEDPTAALAVRQRQLAQHCRAPLDLLATTPGKRRVERWFHKRHVGVALGGEWFSATTRLLADIEVLASGRRVMGQPLPAPPVPHRSRYRCWIVWPSVDAGVRQRDWSVA